MPRGPSFFRGSELPRLLVLLVASWSPAGWWPGSTGKVRPAAKPAPVSSRTTRPVVPDRSIEFESVTDRTPMSLRDNAAYVARCSTVPASDEARRAGEVRSRRDVLLTHIWERPELYRGVPIHLEGTAADASATSRSSARPAGSTRPGSTCPMCSAIVVRLRLRRAAQGLPAGLGYRRGGRVQRLFPQDHGLPGGHGQPAWPRG